MATAVYMPKQGMSMEEGTLIRWLKKVGDHVDMNEPIMEIETDKITMEAESPAEGYLIATLADENDVVPVLATMGWIGAKDETPPTSEIAATAGPDTTAATAASTAANTTAKGEGDISATPYARKLAAEEGVSLSGITGTGKHGEITSGDVKASPVAARLAQAKGVDLAAVSGSGFQGKVMKADVEHSEAKCASVTTTARAENRTRLSGMRKVIGERMHSSCSEIPAAVLMLSADVTKLFALRAEVNEGAEKEDKLTFNDFVLKAVAKALSETPSFRARVEGNELVSFDYVDLGCAVSVDGGLLVPVIKDADKMSIIAIHKQVKDYSARAKQGKLLPDELKGSCFSVSNLGSYGIEFSTPIINQPDSGILGVGGIKDELYFNEDGSIASRKVMGLSLSFDHRINDGVPGALFLNKIKSLLENPIKILI